MASAIVQDQCRFWFAVALSLGASLWSWGMPSSLISAEWNSLALRARDVPRLLGEEGVRETQSTRAEDQRSSEQVQVIDSTNQVVAWSTRRVRGEPISALRPAPGKTAKEELSRVPSLGEDDEVLVSTRGVKVKGEAYVVLVAEPLEVQTDTLRTVGLLLLAASPLLIALVGVAVWVLVGQSLKTVERIRRQVAEIDDGEIISPQDRDRVFERFARLDASRSSEGGGSGLGLAISREIMLAHGGTVVASEWTAGVALR